MSFKEKFSFICAVIAMATTLYIPFIPLFIIALGWVGYRKAGDKYKYGALAMLILATTDQVVKTILAYLITTGAIVI